MYSEAMGLWPVGLLGSIGIILYWYLTKNFNYWSKQGISGPKPLIIFGTFLDRIRDCWVVSDVKYLKKYGNVYGIFDATTPVLHIADPELIEIVLVKEFNRFNNRKDLRTYHPIVNKTLFFARYEDWKRIRYITRTTFTSLKLKKLYGLIRKCVRCYDEHLDELEQKGENLNAKTTYENFSMDVIACCAFSTETNAIKDTNNTFIVKARNVFNINIFGTIPAFIFPKFLNNLLNVKTFFDPKSTEWIINVLKHIVRNRIQTGEKNNDFVQLLIDAKADDYQKEDMESIYDNQDEEGISERKNFINKSLSEDEIIAQCWIFLLGGYETSASTLGYMSRLMALNPECQEKLHNEVVSAMGSDNEISYDDLHRLPYLDACISETLRLYSPGIRIEREVNQDFILGDSGIRLFKGQVVEILVYAMHRSEKYFKDADKFVPERFMPENRHQIIPYTYIPFGMGPRNCVGIKFALMELKLAMAHILFKYKFTKCDKTDEIKFKPGTPLLTPFSVVVGIEKRKNI